MLLQEAGRPGSGFRHVRSLLQLPLADPDAGNERKEAPERCHDGEARRAGLGLRRTVRCGITSMNPRYILSGCLIVTAFPFGWSAFALIFLAIIHGPEGGDTVGEMLGWGTALYVTAAGLLYAALRLASKT